MLLLATVLLALTTTAAGAPAPTAPPATTTTFSSTQPTAKALPPVIINGVLFRAIEFDTGNAVWRNLAITVASDRLSAWTALTVAVKNQYAGQMIEAYRAGMKYGRDIKLSFVDERNTTLDQYLWTPSPDRK